MRYCYTVYKVLPILFGVPERITRFSTAASELGQFDEWRANQLASAQYLHLLQETGSSRISWKYIRLGEYIENWADLAWEIICACW